MSDDIEIQAYPRNGLVKITLDEEVAWMIAHGKIMVMMIDGERYRVIDPWEDGSH